MIARDGELTHKTYHKYGHHSFVNMRYYEERSTGFDTKRVIFLIKENYSIKPVSIMYDV